MGCILDTPSNFDNWNNDNEFIVGASGELTTTNVNVGYGVRPISKKWGLIYLRDVFGYAVELQQLEQR